jgi:hypothetical protein
MVASKIMAGLMVRGKGPKNARCGEKMTGREKS